MNFFLKLIFIFIFFLNISLITAQSLIPQRLIFIKKETTSDGINLYIEKEIEKVFETLDSELLIRYTKESEYNDFKYLLQNLTEDNMKKFYFNTNIRGAISFSLEEGIVYLELYNFNESKIIKEKFSFEKDKIIEQINSFNDFVIKNIKEKFPLINKKTLEKEKFSIIKIVREIPDFSLDLKFNIGYGGKYIVEEKKGESISKETNDNNMFNGILNGVSVQAKIKLFYIGGELKFLPYFIPNDNRFWFDLLFSFETGLYLIQEILLIKIGIISGILKNINWNNEEKITPKINPYIEIGALPTKYIYPFFGFGFGLLFYNIPGVDYFFYKSLNDTAILWNLFLKFGFTFYFKNNFFMGIETENFFILNLNDSSISVDNNKYNINISFMRSTAKIIFGYRFEKKGKK